ncbi:MAG: methyltransferase [Rhodobacteraceae bacterium]|jgi:16S rRNA (guanine1207-N2)-methyltransferase|nr:methyltransferase [Paracoccaceae bacterium]
MRSARLEMALATGAFAMPDSGMLGVYGPQAGDDLSCLPRGQVTVITGFFPDHAAFKAQGYAVRHDGAGAYAAAIVCLPRAKAAARGLLAQAAAEVAPGGLIAVDGQKTDGIDTALRDLRGRVAVSPALSKAHGKLFTFTASPAFADWAARPQMVAGFQTLPGVFSADGPDAGSALLAAALPPLKGRVADLGAGWGYLSRTILASADVRSLDVVEADHAALTCAAVNVPDPRVHLHWADARQFRPAHLLDHVVMNPPFHVGRSADPALGIAFLQAARRMLAPSGVLWLVANRTLPYDPVLRTLFRGIDDIGGTPAYRLIRASGPVREQEIAHVAVHRR